MRPPRLSAGGDRMIEDSHLMFEIAELTAHALNGTLDEKGLRQLEELLERNPIAVEYYQEMLWTFVGIKSMEGISCLQEVDNGALDRDFWQAMLQQEKDAPVAEIPEEETSRELIQKIVRVPQERKISRFNIFTLAMSIAAILFITLFLKFAPPAHRVEVATLSDSINAKWADMDASEDTGSALQIGSRLVARESIQLNQGLAELVFDNNTKITLEAPAELHILSGDQIKLTYGQLYAVVPQQAIGFMVNTPTSRIIDLGTEFGVEADSHGVSYLQMIKGRTTLIAGIQGDNRQVRDVSEGMSLRVDSDSQVSEIKFRPNHFARNIDSKEGMVWRGENLNLASIVAGYDGFQEVGSLISLDPLKGELMALKTDVYRETNKAYNLVPQLKFIDGVFVPDGEFGPVQISSSGQTFRCPDTSGIFTHEISAYKGPIKNQHETIPPVIINGREVINEAVLMLHSNIGITFDLQAIRKTLPQLNIKSLKATGIPMTETTFPELKFWILVDGQIKYEREIVGMDSDRGPTTFDVEFGPQDRFMTLIVTDVLRATEGEDGNIPAYASDFFYLIKPELCLTDGLGK